MPPITANSPRSIPINNINEKVIFKMPTKSRNQSGNPYCLNYSTVLAYRTTHTNKTDAATNACREIVKLFMSRKYAFL